MPSTRKVPGACHVSGRQVLCRSAAVLSAAGFWCRWFLVPQARGAAYEECGIGGRPVRCTAVTAASCPIRPWPADCSFGCRRLPLPSGHALCCARGTAPVDAGPGTADAFIAAARWSATSGLMRGWLVSSPILFFPSSLRSSLKRNAETSAGRARTTARKEVFPSLHDRHPVRSCEPLQIWWPPSLREAGQPENRSANGC